MRRRQKSTILAVCIVGLFVGTSIIPAFSRNLSTIDEVKKSIHSDDNDYSDDSKENNVRNLFHRIGQRLKQSNYDSLPSKFQQYREQMQDKHFPQTFHRSQPIPIDGVEGEWDIIVPDGYSSIQAAIDNVGPQNGYRIFVRSGTYHENIVIDADGFILHGENKENTIIDGGGDGNVITLDSKYNNISGFTIQNSGTDYAGIFIDDSSGNQVFENKVINNNGSGLFLYRSHANNITNNMFVDNNQHGICVVASSLANTISNNQIQNNKESGVLIDNVARSNLVAGNTIESNYVGVNITGVSKNNIIHHNQFIDNNQNGFDNCYNYWDDQVSEGNYWSDYTGKDSNNDGIGDSPFQIHGGDNKDQYPLMGPPAMNSFSFQACHKRSDESGNFFNNSYSYSGNTIVVPDDYVSIQEAVNNSNDGDIIEVKSGIYKEHVVVDKKVKIIGDDLNTTFVDGSIDKRRQQVDQEQSLVVNGMGCWDKIVLAQSFIASMDSLTMIDLLITKKGFPDKLEISIRDDLYGNDLCSAVIFSTEVSSSKFSWVSINFSEIRLIEGRTYYIIWNPGKDDSQNLYFWGLGIFDMYNRGCGWFYTGDEWSSIDTDDYPDLDFCFKTYGNKVVSSPGYIFEVNADNVYISGFTIQHTTLGFAGIKIDSHNVMICDNILYDCGDGIYVSNAKNISIENNMFKNNNFGIYLSESETINITNNLLKFNSDGLAFFSCNTLTIRENNLSMNIFTGVLQLSSCYVRIIKNIIENNIGLQMFKSNKNNINSNNLKNCLCGLLLYKSRENICINNSFNKSSFGISLNFQSIDNAILNNKIRSTFLPLFFGITLFNDCNNNTITGNIISDIHVLQSFLVPIQIIYSSNNSISDNIIDKIDGPILSLNSIALMESKRNSVSGNLITNIRNTDKALFNNGIILIRSDNSIIKHNDFNNNDNFTCIVLNNSSNNIILNNDISKGDIGISLFESVDNEVTGNNLNQNSKFGVLLKENCSDNLLFHNNFLNNKNNAMDEGRNIWYSQSERNGNYWSDYTENYPNASLGFFRPWIWKQPYAIPGGDNKDYFPLSVFYSEESLLFILSDLFHRIFDWKRVTT